MLRRTVLATPLLPLPVAAQEARPIRLVIAFPPGGSTDALGRLLAPRVAERLAAPVVPENRAGASGAIAAGFVAQAAPDGQTLLLDSGGQTVNPSLLRGLAFDYARDLAPVTRLATLPLVLVVRSDLGARDLAMLLARLRSEPRLARYGSVGVGARTHLAMAALMRRAGIAAEHIPYRGGADQIQGLLRGDVPMGFTSVALAAPLLGEGRLRALALSSAARSPALPDLPSIAEQGFAGFAFGDWLGLFVPSGTPRPVIARLAEVAAAAMGEPSLAPRLTGLGLEPAAEGPEALAAFLAAERREMAALIAAERITLD